MNKIKYKENRMVPVFVENQVPHFEYESLNNTGIVSHMFSTRLGGVSTGVLSTMNLSTTRGDSFENLDENYQRVAAFFGVEKTSFVLSDQTHTTNVRRVSAKDAGKGLYIERDYSDIDGLITNEPGLVLTTFYADCVPLYFVDPVKKAIGLSHSGWRGTVGRMGEKTILAMTKEFGSNPKDIICAIGPSICKDCYEISEDVAREFIQEFGLTGDCDMLTYTGNGKYHLDLWEANYVVLRDAGVLAENIEKPSVCTCCNPDLLFSHRASNGKRGNLAALMCLKKS